MKNSLKRIAYFPGFALLAGVLPILALWANNKLQIKPQAAWLPLAGTLVFVGAVWLLCAFALRSFRRGNLMASFLFLWFFSFGHVYNLIKGKQILGAEIGFIKLMAVYLLLLVVFLVFFRKIKTPSPNTALFLNIGFSLLLVFNAFQTVISYNQSKSTNDAPAVLKPVVSAGNELPDIYYIILDAYSRQDVLLEKMGFDNSWFVATLRERGFYVADCANSNYIDTMGSVASSLNYSYLHDLLRNDSNNDATVSGAIQNNAIDRDFAALGYKFVTTAGYSSFNDIQNSDLYLNVIDDASQQGRIQLMQFTSMYLQTTALRFFFELYTMNPSNYPMLPSWLEIDSSNLGGAKFWYLQTNYVFDELEKLPGQDGNYFVYAHLNAPHGPFVFDPEGNFRYVSEPENPIPYYNDMVTYINSRVLKLVDALIANSDVLPIIIIQGDHGAHVITTNYEKHKILNAYYIAGRSDIPFYKTITPVNSFRMVLKYYFNRNIDLIPDTISVDIDGKEQMVPSQCQYP